MNYFKKFCIIIGKGSALLAGTILIVFFALRFYFSPHQQKPVSFSQLKSQVTITEDAFGVPTLRGKSLTDLVFIQGWITARDRLFQLDLSRRRAAGRLSEIVGEKMLEDDKLRRIYGFSVLANQAVKLMTRENLALLQAFADGVNAFIAEGPLPVEMYILNYRPEPWKPADSLLVALNMFDPNDKIPNEEERVLTRLYEKFPSSLIDFLTPEAGFLDAPMIPDPSPIKKRDWFPKMVNAHRELDNQTTAKSPNASNAWAVSGKFTQSGLPMLAGDPHLGLSVPNIWYRLRLESPTFSVTGVSLPGIPLILIGSNGHIAWSFTNAMADIMDSVPLKMGHQPEHYISESKEIPFAKRSEIIKVRNQKDISFEVKNTIWGPVYEDGEHQLAALQWTALDPAQLSQALVLPLCEAKDINSAFAALKYWGGPVMNAVIATHDGHIGWTMVGHLPNRVGFDGRTRVVRDKNHYWNGYIPFSELPHLLDPPSGLLVNSNQRSIPLSHPRAKYTSNWPSPARAFRIRELLEQKKNWTAQTMASIQTDVYTHTHIWYRDTLEECANKWPMKLSKEAKQLIQYFNNWNGQITTDSTAYPLIKKFRLDLISQLEIGQLPNINDADKESAEDLLSRDAVVAQFKDSGQAEFCEIVLARATAVLKEKPKDFIPVSWGTIHHSEIRHPFSSILPSALASLINMPNAELPGDSLVPPSNEPRHGASMRMVVDLADPKNSLFIQPGGQSGNIFSKHYGDQFTYWIQGKLTAFEPGMSVEETIAMPTSDAQTYRTK